MGANLEISRRLLSADKFHRMGEAGILAPDDQVELIEGELIQMAPIGSWHAGTVASINRLFSRCVGNQAIIWVQRDTGARHRPGSRGGHRLRA